jgi:hypothetical protein
MEVACHLSSGSLLVLIFRVQFWPVRLQVLLQRELDTILDTVAEKTRMSRAYPVAHGRPDLTAQPPIKDVGAHTRLWVKTVIIILITGLVVGTGVTIFALNNRRRRRLGT